MVGSAALAAYFTVAIDALTISLGRKNWNIPKHLARFSFTKSGNSLTLEVSPSATDSPPFLKVNLAPFSYVPAIPFSTNMSKWIGMDLRLAQPPLPAATQTDDSKNDVSYLCGTEEWKIAVPEIWGDAKCCWINLSPLSKKSGDENTPLLSSAESRPDGLPAGDANAWWPSYAPWKVGLCIENGKINFKNGEEKGAGSRL
jgi:hypothetical protein